MISMGVGGSNIMTEINLLYIFMGKLTFLKLHICTTPPHPQNKHFIRESWKYTMRVGCLTFPNESKLFRLLFKSYGFE